MRSEVMDRTMALCRELDLEVTIELANDPFSRCQPRQGCVPGMGEVKFELLFPLPYRTNRWRHVLQSAS